MLVLSSSSSSSSVPPDNERNLARCKLLTRNFERIRFVACKMLQFFTARRTVTGEARELNVEERLGAEDE